MENQRLQNQLNEVMGEYRKISRQQIELERQLKQEIDNVERLVESYSQRLLHSDDPQTRLFGLDMLGQVN
jgi:D-mannonate dehydratase